MKKIARFLIVAVMSVSLSGCALLQTPYYRDMLLNDPKMRDMIVAAAVAGLVGAALIASHRSGSGGPSSPYSPYTSGPLPSDGRLKVDVEKVAEFRGIAIHAFRYKGDDRVFTGVIAQELLANPLHRAAVVEKDGFYAVDYAALGLQVAGADQMMEAAQGAIARAGL